MASKKNQNNLIIVKNLRIYFSYFTAELFFVDW